MLNDTPKPSELNLAEPLTAQAIQILKHNSRTGPWGSYTIPTEGLYPFQWNWDAAFSSLGWIRFDEPRAWAEFDSLLAGLWQDQTLNHGQAGLLPHIIFHQTADTYFPGPEQWGVEPRQSLAPTSSISQPPVHATLLLWMYERAKDKAAALAALQRIVPKLIEHHLWWYRCRDPKQTGLIVTVHPWETGRDNSPDWDAALDAVPRTQRPYQRKDLAHADASQRPRHIDYDRFVYLMDFMREQGFNAQRILQTCPFQMHDTGLIFILHRASRDLQALAQLTGHREQADALLPWMQATTQYAQQLWSDEIGQFSCANALTGQLTHTSTYGGLLAWYAFAGQANLPASLQAQLTQQVQTLRQWRTETPALLPSTRSTSPSFDAKRYWRGPAWVHMHLLIVDGLAQAGEISLAHAIKRDVMETFAKNGFCEYYDPLTGEGLGGKVFSWTAASYLHWA